MNTIATVIIYFLVALFILHLVQGDATSWITSKFSATGITPPVAPSPGQVGAATVMSNSLNYTNPSTPAGNSMTLAQIEQFYLPFAQPQSPGRLNTPF